MQFSVTVHGNNQSELAAGLRAHLALFEGSEKTTTATTTEKTTKRSAKPAKETEETFDDTETTDTESEETETDDKETEVTADQVRAACATYVKKLIAKGNSAEDARAKVRSILKKNFKVTMVDQLETDQLAEALELMS